MLLPWDQWIPSHEPALFELQDVPREMVPAVGWRLPSRELSLERFRRLSPESPSASNMDQTWCQTPVEKRPHAGAIAFVRGLAQLRSSKAHQGPF